MAIPHLNRDFVKRSQGDSVVAKAAYNARERLENERTGDIHDYTRQKSKCIFKGLYVPKDAPEWAHDRAELWNRAERAERRKDAQLGQTFDIALPHELTDEQNRWLVQEWVRENFTRNGLVADVTIHEPSRDMDERNIHAHVLVAERVLTKDGFAPTKPQKNKADLREEEHRFRKSWERLANRHLERHGHEARIDMGRTKDGNSIHLGKAAKGMEARGIQTDRGDMQREVDQLTAARAEIAELEALQREAFRRQDRERGNVMWDGEYTSTLDGIRQREAAENERRSSSDASAKRAMDDLARTDPLGTERVFGHHRGDKLKTPEQQRAEWAATLRGLVDEPEPEQDLGRDRQQERRPPDPAASKSTDQERGNPRSWTRQGDGWDGLTPEQQGQARRSWEAWTNNRTAPGKGFDLPDYVAYVQRREAEKQAARGTAQEKQQHQAKPQAPSPQPSQARPDPVDERRAWADRLRGESPQRPQEARTAAQERPGATALRAALSAAHERLQALGGRLDAAYMAIRERTMSREAATVHNARAKEPEAAPYLTRSQDVQQHSQTRDDSSSKKANRDFADELIAQAREALAKEAAVDRSQAYEHDRIQRDKEQQEVERVREMIRQEKRMRRPNNQST